MRNVAPVGAAGAGALLFRFLPRGWQRAPPSLAVRARALGWENVIVIDAGATDFATIRSFIATAKKQGWNVIQAIAQEPKVLVNSLRIARLPGRYPNAFFVRLPNQLSKMPRRPGFRCTS
jgi:hypothetical protein